MLETVLKTVIIYIVIMLSLRIMGKRQMSQLEPSELVVAVLISDIAAAPIIDEHVSLAEGIVPVVTLVICEVLVAVAMLKSVRFRSLMFGKPAILIENGVIDQSQMKKNRIPIDELTEGLRAQGITDISTVKYAILETDGSLNILPYPAENPVTAKLMGINPEDPGYPVIVIDDGRVINENLVLKGLDEKWLKKELKKRNIGNEREVFLLTVDDLGRTYFAAKRKQP